ncbi:MAG: flagellar basal body rod protein FlgB [Desulfopila sp.]
MIPRPSHDPNIRLLAKVLDLRAQNQQVIAANIANAETPGYAPATFHFDKALQAATGTSEALPLAAPRSGHIDTGGGGSAETFVTRTPDATGIGDRNGVSVDQEMLKLSENEIMYETAAQLLRKKLGMIKYVVSNGQ